METLTTADDVLAASRGDPLVTHLLASRVPGSPAYGLDGAVLLLDNYWDEDHVDGLVVGPAEASARLLVEAADALAAVDHVSVPEQAVPLLPAGLLEPGPLWRFRWTDRRPAPPTAAAGWMTEGEWPEVDALLDDAFPDASVRPGRRHARRWAGIRDRRGALVACAADCTESEVGFMASVASRVSARGTGVGLAVTCWLTHALLDEHERVGLWQYGDNVVATALYDRLGYHDDHGHVAGKLLPR